MNAEPFWRSRKVFAAVTGTVLAMLPVLLADPGMTPSQKREQWREVILATSALWGAVVVMQGVEGYAERRDSPSPGQPNTPAPQVQVNTGDNGTATQTPAPPPPPPPSPWVSTSSIVDKPKGTS